MKTINVLEPSIYNLISAGEVAVNPAGVVKELVENSLDAQATKIIVEIWGGGIEKIKVTDNGYGIAKSQVKNAFLPHATSKITTVEDIYKIGTLGFRGEALASICNVSKLSILTRVEEEEIGSYLEIDAGNIVVESEKASNVGTEITVSNLFYNTPARLKFLGTKKMEQREIAKTLENLMLCNPNIEFMFYVDGNLNVHTAGTGLKDTIVQIEGPEFIEKSFKIDVQEGKYKLKGYGILPSEEHNSKFTRCFVNGRVTINHCIASAVQAAYVTYTMKGITPTFILFFELPFDEVDVNITPQKTDVKFQDDHKIYSWVCTSVKNSLLNHVARENFYKSEELAMQAFLSDNKDSNTKMVLPKKEIEGNESNNTETKNSSFNDYVIAKNVVDSIGGKSVTAEQFLKAWKGQKEQEELAIQQEAKNEGSDKTVKILEFESKTQEFEQESFGLGSSSTIMAKVKGLDKIQAKQEFTQETFVKNNNKVLGVIFQTYILVQSDSELFFIDQHAAHERHLYDKYMQEIENRDVTIQDLLVPHVINADNDMANFIERNMLDLKNLGFEISSWGTNVFKVESVPMILSDINLEHFIQDIYQNKVYLTNTNEQLRDKIAMRACKSAIKAGMTLNQSEIDKVIEMIKESKSPLLCPHGRPYVLKVTKTDIEKWFKRIV